MEQQLRLVRKTSCHHNFKVSCNNCRLNTLCLPLSLNGSDVDDLDAIIQRGRPVQKGEHIFYEGGTFTSIYAVRSGTVKTFSISEDGREQVAGFYFPGELLGMDGISRNIHQSNAVALETSAVCEIPFKSLGELSAKLPSLQSHFFQLMSREITEDQQLITLLGKSSAEERFAAFLLSISSRNSRRNLSSTRFRLPMSRVDIGNYLGLTIETISRVIGRLQKQEIVVINNKEVEIVQYDSLLKVARVQWSK